MQEIGKTKGGVPGLALRFQNSKKSITKNNTPKMQLFSIAHYPVYYLLNERVKRIVKNNAI